VVADPDLGTLLSLVSDYFVQVRYGHEFGVYPLSEYPITVFADALYLHCAARHDQGHGVADIRI
jgi:hypothetical protein